MVALVLVLLAAAMPVAAIADTPASCTTDTATQYCEQVSTGTNADAAASGFVIVETSMGVLIGMTFTFWVLRKVLAAGGWAPW